MPARATVSSDYRWRRLAGLMVLCLGMGGWFSYDGFVLYPHQRHIAQEFRRFEQEGRKDQWTDYAHERGWPDGREGPPIDRSELDIRFQQIMGVALAPVGLVLAYMFLMSFRRSIASDESGLVTDAGRQVPYEAITALNKRLWSRKGVAYVHYKHGGAAGLITLDDWKYDRQAIHQILRDVEARVRPEQIEGGPPLPPAGHPAQAAPADPSANSAPPA